MKKAFLAASLVAIALAVVPSIAGAASINMRTTSSDANLTGGNARFDGAGGIITLQCSRHDLRATSRGLSSGGSTNTSLRLLAAENAYGGTCTYTILGLSGRISVRINCDWLLTAQTTTTGTIELTADRCIEITLTDGSFAGCSLTLNRQTIRGGRLSSGATDTTIDASRLTITYATNNRTCGGDTGGTAAQTERVLARTITLSP